MNLIAVGSSGLARVAFDEQRTELHVVFRDAAIYQYFGVPLEIYRELLQADSKGSYFNRHIRTTFPGAIRPEDAPGPSQLPGASAKDQLG